MSKVIGILNHGIAGNIHSIEKAIKKAGGDTVIVDRSDQFDCIDKLVIPGVGSFKDTMQKLKSDELITPLKNNTKPVLGICLGMQILSTVGFEYGKTEGLGFIEGEVKPIMVNAKVPHMGFNKIEVIKTNDILDGIENEEFYFMHSYEVKDSSDATSVSRYAGHEFISSIHKGHVYGVQFHPENSRDAGIRLFNNFINIGVK